MTAKVHMTNEGEDGSITTDKTMEAATRVPSEGFDPFDPHDARWNQPKRFSHSNDTEAHRCLSETAIRALAEQGLVAYQAADGSLWYDPQQLKELVARQERELEQRSLHRNSQAHSLVQPPTSTEVKMTDTPQPLVNADG